MTNASISFVATRPKVLFPGLFGLGLLLGHLSAFWGVGFLAYAVFHASRIMAHDDLDLRLRLKADKERHGIGRLLFDGERREIFALDRYCTELDHAGVDKALTADILDHGWNIIATHGNEESTVQLHQYREGLPPTKRGQNPFFSPDVAQRIDQELVLLHAAQQEVHSV